MGGIHASNHLATLADPQGATVIIDAAIWNGPGRIGLVAANPTLTKNGGTVYCADNLTDLARLCGLPADALTATVESYNCALIEKTAQGLGALIPPRTQSKAKAMPILTAPFMAIPVCSGITNTMGGLSIDSHARVQTIDGQPIEGLYAAGAATGGLEGGPRVDYVGGLIKAVVFGMLAAEHAAAICSKVHHKETLP
jgi:fumarate reductase flavoprotein subunit